MLGWHDGEAALLHGVILGFESLTEYQIRKSLIRPHSLMVKHPAYTRQSL